MQKSFEIPLYGGYLNVCVFTDLKESIEECGFEYDNDAEHYDRICISTTENEYYVFVPIDVTPGGMASIARKICKQIFDSERITISIEQVEHECRLIEWIVDQIYIVLNDTKIKKVYAKDQAN